VDEAVHAWSLQLQLASTCFKADLEQLKTVWFAKSLGCRRFICPEGIKIGKTVQQCSVNQQHVSTALDIEVLNCTSAPHELTSKPNRRNETGETKRSGLQNLQKKI
jgi:hypothetical protein